jgi:hypothetical protein
MAEKGFKRKLTAILNANVKGYSILMADDEVATMQTLKGHNRTRTGPNLKAYAFSNKIKGGPFCFWGN